MAVFPGTGTAETVWLNWATNTTITATASTTWSAWNNMTASGSAMLTWASWISNGTGSQPVVLYPNQSSPPETEEQRLAREARMRLANEQYKEREQQRLLRKERARELLVGALDKTQRAEFEKTGYFHVQTKNGERVYRLRPGGTPILIKSDDGRGYSYCIHPVESYPSEDTALALKLLLEADEEAFLRIANATPWAGSLA